MQDLINKITHGDCLEVMKTIPDKSIDLVLTDPPYGINYQSNMRSNKFEKIENDNNDMRFIAYDIIYRILKDNCVAILFCSYKNFADDYKYLQKQFSIKNVIVWDKGGGGIGDLSHSLLTDYELAIIAHKGQCLIRGKREGSVWDFGKVNPNFMVHPTEKPIPLLKKCIEKFSDESNLILDCFSGSGTTAIACSELKRNFICIEKDKQYYEASCQRLENYNKQLKLF